MLVVSSTKGGVGCSVTCAAIALLSAEQRSTLLVDLGGDLPTILGIDGSADPEATAPGPGVLDWLAASRPPPDALGRLEHAPASRLSVLPFGAPASDDPAGGDPDRADPGSSARLDVLGAVLAGDGRFVIVDVGAAGQRFAPLLDRADVGIHVTRACYLALRRRPPRHRGERVVVIREPGRALRPADIAAAIGGPPAAVLHWDPAVARAVDAGLLHSRLPRSLRPLRTLVAGQSRRAPRPPRRSRA